MIINELVTKLKLDINEFEAGMNKAAEKVGFMQRGMNGLGMVGGGILAGGLLAAGTAAAGLGIAIASSIGPASDLNETVSKTKVVFGESAQALIDFGATAAGSLGMSENAALTAMATYGNLFRSMGTSEEASAKMSKGLVQLAGDLASFNNANPEEVMDALRAGLVGEAEPLRRLGININQATVEAKAMELGLWDGVGAIDANAKAQAVYALAMEQTTLAQGDFARTSEGVANQQRIMAANIENIRAKFGTAFLPVISRLTSMFNGLLSNPAVMENLKNFGDILANIAGYFIDVVVDGEPLNDYLVDLPGFIRPVVQALGTFVDFMIVNVPLAFQWLSQNQGVIVAILAVVGAAIAAFVWTTVIPALGALIVAAAPVILIMAAIGLAAYLLYQAWTTNFGGIQEKVGALIAFISPYFQMLVMWLQNYIPLALALLASYWQEVLWPAIQVVWAWISTNLLPLLSALGQVVGAVLVLAVTALAGLWQNVLWPALQKVWEFLKVNVLPILQTVGEFIASKFTPAWKGITDAIQEVVQWLGKVKAMLDGLKLPDWLTPGSPTPFELGLLGIRDAMKDVNGMSVGMSMVPEGVLASGSMAASTGGPIIINVTSDGVHDEYDIARKIAGAVDVRLREQKLI